MWECPWCGHRYYSSTTMQCPCNGQQFHMRSLTEEECRWVNDYWWDCLFVKDDTVDGGEGI
jgi:hypothetical protein